MPAQRRRFVTIRTSALKSILIILLAAALPALACNIPISTPTPNPLTVEELVRTLQSLPTATPVAQASPAASPIAPPTPLDGEGIPQTTVPPSTSDIEGDHYIYPVQSGDTLPALAARFGVTPEEIGASLPLPAEVFLPIGLVVHIPYRVEPAEPSLPILPDSGVVFSPSSAGFDIPSFVSGAGGYLSTHTEQVDGRLLTGAEIVRRVAIENSINPRLLLTFIEQRTGWLFGHPSNPDRATPLGFNAPNARGLYLELILVAKELNTGYYGWRMGTVTELEFENGSVQRIDPRLNAGSAGLLRLFSRLYFPDEYENALRGESGFLALYSRLFGDPQIQAVEPLLPDGLAQPTLELPFAAGERWSFSGGPHNAWNAGSPPGGIDFSPVTGDPACAPTSAWVRASAPGVVTRSGDATVAIDLDGDGYEGTGWVLVYLHIPDADRVPVGTVVSQDSPIGHPSCERGTSTGTNVHLARRYNGEWLPADGPLPFVLSGWEVVMGEKNYAGFMVNGDRQVIANPSGPGTSIIVR